MTEDEKRVVKEIMNNNFNSIIWSRFVTIIQKYNGNLFEISTSSQHILPLIPSDYHSLASGGEGQIFSVNKDIVVKIRSPSLETCKEIIVSQYLSCSSCSIFNRCYGTIIKT